MMEKSVRVLSWAQNDGGVVWFTNEDEDTPLETDATQVQIPERDWDAMGCPTEMTITLEPGDRLNVGMAGTQAPAGERVEGATEFPDRQPHSRACGFRKHEHGPDCSENCPTCQGRPK